jgi:hypothetical protein
MRVLKEFLLTNEIKATLFSWNGKYIAKLEKGLLEQTYKVSETDVSGLQEVEDWLSGSEFKTRVETIFDQMDENLDLIF